jgi:hypothetical protein
LILLQRLLSAKTELSQRPNANIKFIKYGQIT